MDFTNQTINAESGGNPNAANPNSSALGLGGFINSTWLDMIRKYRPDLAQGKTDQQILALRTGPGSDALNRQMVGAYAQQNGQTLTGAGFDATPGNLYLAHFAGPGGALAVLKADPNAPVGQLLGPQVVAANPFLKGMTAGQLAQWAAGKVGGGGSGQPPAQGVASQPPVQEAAPQVPADAQASYQPQQQAAPEQPQQAAAQPSGGGFTGWLSGEGGQQGGWQQQPMQQVAASPSAPAPMQLPQGTLASQLMRARLLASILGQQSA